MILCHGGRWRTCKRSTHVNASFSKPASWTVLLKVSELVLWKTCRMLTFDSCLLLPMLSMYHILVPVGSFVEEQLTSELWRWTKFVVERRQRWGAPSVETRAPSKFQPTIPTYPIFCHRRETLDHSRWRCFKWRRFRESQWYGKAALTRKIFFLSVTILHRVHLIVLDLYLVGLPVRPFCDNSDPLFISLSWQCSCALCFWVELKAFK